VVIDATRERADIVPERPPFNIIAMAQRDQLRLVFESLDENPAVRVIVLRSVGEHFSSGGDIRGFLDATPEHGSKLAWNIAAPARVVMRSRRVSGQQAYDWGIATELEGHCYSRLRGSDDFREGVEAFHQKRKPDFKGR
jgi:2-oxoglutaroyl-CoA hydrolase